MSLSAPSSPRSPSKMTSALTMGTSHPPPPAHNVFSFDNIVFSSNFDNGNLGRVERVPNRPYEFKVWTAPDNMGTEFQSKHCAWFHFSVAGLPMGCVLRIQLVNASNHSGLYKHDMRPVYRSSATNQKWVRIRSSVRFIKEGENAQLYFEHSVDADNDKIFFAFTYPYTYTQMQTELANFDMHTNCMDVPDSIFYQRELLTSSCDGRRLDLLTITSVNGASTTEKEPLLPGLFPDTLSPAHSNRPPVFPTKEVIIVSARVHPGEVPAQHTFKGVLSLLMDPDDQTARELRARYVFKLIPMLNPDGVFRGHFRMDQHGHNLNRYYNNPDPTLQPTIYAAKSLLDYYAQAGRLSMYLDMHAHASKRGCFIYGNVLDQVEDQIQNQLYCKLISMNSAHFDYEGCLFSREHMFRIDPGDQAKGLTAEGSGRVHTYLAYGLVHSYTLECNYNTSRIGNEVAPPEQEIAGQNVTLASPFTTNPEKYTPSSWAGVGRACIVAMLDIRGQNPCSRIPKSKFKTLDRVRNAVVLEVRNRKEYQGKQMSRERRRSISDKKLAGTSATQSDEFVWRRVVDGYEVQTSGTRSGTTSGRSSSASLTVAAAAAAALEQQARIAAATAAAEASSNSNSNSNNSNTASYLFIPAGKEKRRKTMSGAPVGKGVSSIASTDSAPTTARRDTSAATATKTTAGVAATDSDSATTISVASSSTNQTIPVAEPRHKAAMGQAATVAPAAAGAAGGGRPPIPTAGRSGNQRDMDNEAHHGDHHLPEGGGSISSREKYQHLEQLILESQSARVMSHKTLSPPTAALPSHIHASTDVHEPLTAESFLHTSPSKILHGPLIGNTTKTMQQYFHSLAANPASPSQQAQPSHQHHQHQPQPPLASDHPGGSASSTTTTATTTTTTRPSRPRSADALKSVNSSRRDRSNSNGNSNGNGNVSVEVLVPPAKASPDRSTSSGSSSNTNNHLHQHHSDFAFMDGHFHPLASSSSPPGGDSSSRNSKSSDSSRLGVGASIRDLMREQSIQKLIKLSTHPTMTAPSAATTTAGGTSSTAHSSTNSSAASTPTVPPTAAINSQPAPVPSARRGSNTGLGNTHSPGTNKDNRKILGKTLHAAGVALLMQGPPSSVINSTTVTPTDHATENHPANHLLSVQGMSATSRSSSQANMHHGSSNTDLHIPVPIPHYSHR